jgi:hypothetical protein
VLEEYYVTNFLNKYRKDSLMQYEEYMLCRQICLSFHFHGTVSLLTRSWGRIQALWYTSIIPELWRLRQGNKKFQVSLGYSKTVSQKHKPKETGQIINSQRGFISLRKGETLLHVLPG